MPRVNEKISGSAVHNIHGPPAGVGGDVDHDRQILNHNDAIEHGDGLSVPDHGHIMAQDVSVLILKIVLPIRDMRAAGGLFLKGEDPPDIQDFTFRGEHPVIREQQLETLHKPQLLKGSHKGGKLP